MDDNTTQTTNATSANSSDISSATRAPINLTPEEIEKKKEEAKLAMEGEEGRARREKIEKEKQIEAEIAKLEGEKAGLQAKLAGINKEKEGLELKWVDLSGQKEALQKKLDPIIETEKNSEIEVQKLNQEEHATDDRIARQEIEKRRQDMEKKREDTEKNKWALELEMIALEKIMEENKKKFQILDDDGYSAEKRIEEIVNIINGYKSAKY